MTEPQETCATCERCTWNPGPDCGKSGHPHCPTCGHCEGRHAPTANLTAPPGLLNGGQTQVWWYPAPREGEIVPDYPPTELTDFVTDVRLDDPERPQP